MKTFLSALLVVIASLSARASIFVVTNTNDSGPGSLRQAIVDANADNSAASDEIRFAIPGDGVHTISLLSPLPIASVLIDGYTQPGARPNTLAVGSDAILLIEITGNKSQPSGTAFQAGQFSTIRGLVINGFAIDVDVRSFAGLNAKVVGCYLGTNAAGSALIPPAQSYTPININGAGLGATIGGLAPADRNVIAGSITVRQSNLGQPYTSASILGNYVGLSADGKSFLAPDASVRFHTNAQAAVTNNVIAGYVNLSGSTGTITGNLIGTDALGTTASPGALGLFISSFTAPAGGGFGAGTVVGNVIVATKPSGVISLSKTGPSTVKGNWIGVAADGKTPLGSAFTGIDLRDASNATIGGEIPGDGNVINFAVPAGQTGAGINGIGSSGPNIIKGNSISGIGGLGIDVGMQGVTPNDQGDADGIQNFPVLSSVLYGNGFFRVIGSLNSTPNSNFRIEFFATNPIARVRTYGYYGSASVDTDASGNAFFDVTLANPSSQTRPAISSTATGPNGTSEFSPAASGQLLNIATRAQVKGGDDLVIGGFIITGTDAKKLLLRGIGSSLKIAGRLEDPVIQLFNKAGAFVGGNNDWADSQKAIIEETGLAPTDPKESALLVHLSPGAYTLHLRGFNGASGIGLVEIYDLAPQSSHLANLSTRGRVDSGDNVMIGGFIIGPENSPPAWVLVRGLGPSLTSVPNPLQDPTIEVRDRDGALWASNDNWREPSQNEEFVVATGVPPSDDRESALVTGVAPGGHYTVILRGRNNTSGVGLVEIYRLQ